MHYKIAQVIGLNTDQEAAQVISSNRDNNDIFLAVLQITSDDAFTKGRQILNDLMDFYYEYEGTVAKRLSSTFASASERLIEAENVNLLLAVVSGKVLYIISKGQVSAYLKRAGNVSSLLSIGQPEQLISGFLQDQDRAFFATTNFATLLGEDLRNSLSAGLDEWEEEMTIRISTSGLENQGLSGLLLSAEPEIEKEEFTSIHRSHPAAALNVPISILNEPSEVQEAVNMQPNSQKKNFMSKIKNIFQKFTLNRKLLSRHSPGNYVENDDVYYATEQPVKPWKKFLPRSKKGGLVIGVVLIGIIVGGITFQYYKNKEQEKTTQIQQLIQQAQDELNLADSLKTLNPNESKIKLDAAQTTIDQALTLRPADAQALDFRNKLSGERDRISQQFASASFPLFLDLNLIKEGLQSQQMSLSGKNLLILDQSTKTVVVIDITKKSHQILAGKEQVGDATVSSVNDSFVFTYSPTKGITKVDVSNQKVTSVSKQDKELSGVIDIAGFASNAYILDKDNNQIWKYVSATAGYSGKREYLSSGVAADFSNAIRMRIDSSIYVMKDDGEILRYTRGSEDSFSYAGLDKPINRPKSFFVSSDTNNVYVLDSQNSRVVVVDKKGVYQSQYAGEKFQTASDLVVDEKEKKVYLLDNGKIYITDLK